MKKFIAVGLIMGLLSMNVSAPTAHAYGASTQNGISIQSRSREDFASETFRRSVDNAANAGVNYVTLVVSVHQKDRYANTVYADTNTASDDAIKSGLTYINSKGMKSAIALHDDIYDGWWRALIDPSDSNAWFASYGALMKHYGALAQSVGASEYSIATEMVSMTDAKYTDKWLAMIKDVRSVYNGLVTYSSQHYGGNSDALTLEFWPSLDLIGISAYYPLDGATTKADMMAQWKKFDQLEVSVLAKKYNKPVIFTEVGFVSRDNATIDPATGYALTTPLNMSLQATAYDALLDFYDSSSYVQGMFFWDWSSDPTAGGTNDGNFTPQNKPAEAVMKNWFTTTSTTPQSPAGPTVYKAVSSATSAVTGAATNTPVRVSATNPTYDQIVDLEVYASNGQRVAQKFFEHQNLTAAGTAYNVDWTPTQTGTYTVKVGVFAAGWQSNPYWNNSAVTVVASPAVVTPPVTPTTTPAPVPTPPAATPTPPTPPSTPAPALPTAINIWWPSNGAAVHGVQPFKALIDGRSVSTYDMYWQVDSGQLNRMDDNFNGGAHKESSVDLSGWRWSPSKQYVINFVVKDKAGTVLSQKSTKIHVN